MSTYFQNQPLKILLTVGQDVTGSTDMQIRYTKPNGTTGSWSASSTDTTGGKIAVSTTDGTLDSTGSWRFWSWVHFSDGKEYPGEVVDQKIIAEGDKI